MARVGPDYHRFLVVQPVPTTLGLIFGGNPPVTLLAGPAVTEAQVVISASSQPHVAALAAQGAWLFVCEAPVCSTPAQVVLASFEPASMGTALSMLLLPDDSVLVLAVSRTAWHIVRCVQSACSYRTIYSLPPDMAGARAELIPSLTRPGLPAIQAPAATFLCADVACTALLAAGGAVFNGSTLSAAAGLPTPVSGPRLHAFNAAGGNALLYTHAFDQSSELYAYVCPKPLPPAACVPPCNGCLNTPPCAQQSCQPQPINMGGRWVGTYSQAGGGCGFVTTCPQHMYESSPPTPTTDRQCALCPSSHRAVNGTECAPCDPATSVPGQASTTTGARASTACRCCPNQLQSPGPGGGYRGEHAQKWNVQQAQQHHAAMLFNGRTSPPFQNSRETRHVDSRLSLSLSSCGASYQPQ